MNKRYIDFVPVKTIPKKSSKIVSSTPVKPVENFSVRSTTISRTSMTATVKPKPAASPKTMIPQKPAASSKPTSPSIPSPRFVNTEKIDKRPLSDSVAPKKPTVLSPSSVICSAPEQKSKKSKKSPKTASKASKASSEIIDQPVKSSKGVTVIIVIITILLGAAAGALAFFILPK